MAGRVIYRKRKYLDGFLNPLNENPFTNLVTTEIRITHEARPSISNDGIDKGTPEIPGTEVSADFTPYSINIETGTVNKPLPALLRMRTLTRDAAQQETNAEAWLYARVAFLFFIALMITWVSHLFKSPSVIEIYLANRILLGTFECQSSLRFSIPQQRQLWPQLFSWLRLSTPRFLERHCIYRHIADRMQGTMGQHRGQDSAQAPAGSRHGAGGKAP